MSTNYNQILTGVRLRWVGDKCPNSWKSHEWEVIDHTDRVALIQRVGWDGTLLRERKMVARQQIEELAELVDCI